MREQGVSLLVVTPHVDGSLTVHPDQLAERLAQIDVGWEQLQEVVRTESPDLRHERGAEVMLDTPSVDLSDPRLRLAGTAFALVEFPFMSVPPNSARAISGLRDQGWRPVIPHPERYTGLDEGLRIVEEWRHAQVFCNSTPAPCWAATASPPGRSPGACSASAGSTTSPATTTPVAATRSPRREAR